MHALFRLLRKSIAIARKVPLQPDEEQLIASIFPVASRSYGIIPVANVGDLRKTAAFQVDVGHMRTKGTGDDCRIRPATKFC